MTLLFCSCKKWKTKSEFPTISQKTLHLIEHLQTPTCIICIYDITVFYSRVPNALSPIAKTNSSSQQSSTAFNETIQLTLGCWNIVYSRLYI